MSNSHSRSQARPAEAVLLIGSGGTGGHAVRRVVSRCLTHGRPGPMRCVHVDTDVGPAAPFDEMIDLTLTGDDVEVLRANPAKFGPVVAEFVRKHFALLDDGEGQTNGSCTVRVRSQVAFEFHADKVARVLRDVIKALKAAGGSSAVRPILVSSSGGGAGSALTILLAAAMGPGLFREKLLTGLSPRQLLRPIVFVADPYGYADRNDEIQTVKILTNVYAFRLEAAELQRRGQIRDLYTIGLANDYGTVISEDHEIQTTLGDCVYEFLRGCGPITSHKVNYEDHSHKGRYSGTDTPELGFPLGFAPHVNGTTPEGSISP